MPVVILLRLISFSGLVIRIRGGEINLSGLFVEVSAGVLLSELVSFSIDNNLAGLVELSGIPGTFGGNCRKCRSLWSFNF